MLHLPPSPPERAVYFPVQLVLDPEERQPKWSRATISIRQGALYKIRALQSTSILAF